MCGIPSAPHHVPHRFTLASSQQFVLLPYPIRRPDSKRQDGAEQSSRSSRCNEGASACQQIHQSSAHFAVGIIERAREINGRQSTEQAFCIGAKGIVDAESFAKAARSHWGIENSSLRPRPYQGHEAHGLRFPRLSPFLPEDQGRFPRKNAMNHKKAPAGAFFDSCFAHLFGGFDHD